MNLQDVRNVNAVKMELGGKVRTLQFDMNAFAELEKRYGTIDAAMDLLMAGKIGDVRTILWASLIHEEVSGFDDESGEPTGYNITPYQVGSFIKTPQMLQDVSAKLAEAMGVGMPDPANLPPEVLAAMANKGIDIEKMQEEADQAKNVLKA